jgi:putative tryptophan/tyrosine transport system substrate-binding protein
MSESYFGASMIGVFRSNLLARVGCDWSVGIHECILAIVFVFCTWIGNIQANEDRLAVPRVALYFDTDSPRAKAAAAKLQEAMDLRNKSGVMKVNIRHVAVDTTKTLEIDRAMQANPRADAVLALSQVLAEAAKRNYRDVPVVFSTLADPVKNGLVKSLVKPGGNFAGISFDAGASYKPAEILLSYFPGVRRLGVVVDERWMDLVGNPELDLQPLLKPGQRVELFVLSTADALAVALGTPRARAVDAWFHPTTLAAFNAPDRVVALMSATGKPTIYSRSLMVEKGGLMAYQHDLKAPYERLADILQLVMSGVPPGEIPVERSRDFELSVNVRAARALKPRLSAELVSRADRFVE